MEQEQRRERNTHAHLHSFSVVICTRNRAQLLRRAAEAVFDQDYPKSLYELIIVDNASADETQQIAGELAAESPVTFRLVVEPRLGVSWARNHAAKIATFAYVAYLDDDTFARMDWLRALNATIDEHSASAVGGRVEEMYEDAFVPPTWFDCRYFKGFFRLNYDGQRPPVFRIRYPDYFGAGNCAYAKVLFDHFGGFPTHLGPQGKKRLKGEESYLNLLLERGGVSLYYTDHAVVDHLVSRQQVTRRKLLQASYLGGIELALIEATAAGPRETLRTMLAQLRDLGVLALRLLRAPRHVHVFCTFCQLVRCASFLLEASRLLIVLALRRAFRRGIRGAT
jgi:glycosyltransferase involved in cell wall biosynthesis